MERPPNVIYASSLTRREVRRRRARRRPRLLFWRLGDWVSLVALAGLCFVVGERLIG